MKVRETKKLNKAFLSLLFAMTIGFTLSPVSAELNSGNNYGADYYQYQSPNSAPPPPPRNQTPRLQGRVSFVPAGTPLSVRVRGTFGSGISQIGQPFDGDLDSPVFAGGQMVAGPGSRVQGQIVNVQPAGRGGKPGSIDLRLTSIVTPDGRRYPISASVDKAVFKLSASSGRAGHLAKTTAVGAGSGALAGLIGSAIGGGKKGKATAIGTGIGGGIGLLGGAIKRGKEFILNSGSTIPFRTDTPFQVNVAAPQQAPSGFGGGFGGGAPQQRFGDPGGFGGGPSGYQYP